MTDQTATIPARAPGQLRSLLRAIHPRQALALAVAVGILVALMGRPLREVLVSAAAVCVVQGILGLANEVCDAGLDERAGVAGKPVAQGFLPSGNATFAAVVLLLVAVPLSLQAGLVAGALLLATLVVGLVHNRFLSRGAFSWVGWAATFALLAGFVTYGGWGSEVSGSAPLPAFVVLSALLGVCVHFLTALPDLVADHAAGVRHLPLRIALRIGAPRLLLFSVVVTVGVVVLLGYSALTAGIAR